MTRALLLPLVFAGCATAADPVIKPVAPTAGPTLYQRLGGEPAVAAVVDDFMGRVAKDDRINARFINTDLARLRAS